MACVRVRQLQLQYYLNLTLIITLLLPAVLRALTSALDMPRSDCPDKCGDITIPYPFGIGNGCYRDGFNITCNMSTGTPRAFLGSEPASSIELIDHISIATGEARVYTEIGYLCYNPEDNIYKNNSDSTYIDLSGYPYLFSDKSNKFTAIGCDTYTNFYSIDVLFSACSSFFNSTIGMRDGDSCNGFGCCQISIRVQGLNYYDVWWLYGNNTAWGFNSCLCAMLVEEDWYKFKSSGFE